jgi:adenylate cyclase
MLMLRHIFFCSVYFLFLFQSGYSQDAQTDSLIQVVKTQKDDSIKVINLNLISTDYLNSDIIKEAFQYAKDAQIIALKIGYRKGLAYSIKNIGQGYMKQGEFVKAQLEFKRSLEIFDSIQFKPGIANILSNMGAVYFNKGDDTKAIEYYLRSLKVSEEINDQLRIGTAYNNLGGIYNNKKEEAKALEYFLKALPLFEKIEYQNGIAIVSVNIGEIYEDMKLYKTSLPYFETALKIYEGSVDATFPLTHMGKIYAEQGNFDKAILYHTNAIEIAEGSDAKFELSQSLLGLAKTQAKQKQFEKAIASYLKAEKIAEKIEAKRDLKDAYEALADLFAKQGNFKKAYAYASLLTGINIDLYNSSNDKKQQQLQFNFDIEKKEAEIDLLTKDQALKDATIQRQKLVNYAAGITGFLLLIVIAGFYNRYKYTQRTNKIIKNERDRSKELLLNILPEETARELEINGHAKTRYYENVTVLFTDFKGFSTIAGGLSPIKLVAELNDYFVAFDEIVEKYNLEKIKTIGDAYMCAGGIPTTNDTHPLNAVEAALAMQAYMDKRKKERNDAGMDGWELRIGIHTGPIVAGVVGKKKYAYDIWGDTVNVASRMESNGEPGKVNLSSSTFNFIKDKYQCLYRGKISAKNIGEVDMYFVDEPIKIVS